jgi:hypothetical protein
MSPDPGTFVCSEDRNSPFPKLQTAVNTGKKFTQPGICNARQYRRTLIERFSLLSDAKYKVQHRKAGFKFWKIYIIRYEAKKVIIQNTLGGEVIDVVHLCQVDPVTRWFIMQKTLRSWMSLEISRCFVLFPVPQVVAKHNEEVILTGICWNYVNRYDNSIPKAEAECHIKWAGCPHYHRM